MSRIKLFVATPTTGNICDIQPYFWRKAQEKYGDKIEFIWPEQCVRRQFHDFARNGMVEEFLKTDAEILFFLDSDVCPSTDVLDIVLANNKWEVAGAPYPIFMTPAGQQNIEVMFAIYKAQGHGAYAAADLPSEGIDFVDALGTGCMFIKRHVIEKLTKPYFQFKYNKEDMAMTEGEDLGFCIKVNDLGYKFYTDYSKACKHYKNVDLLDIVNYAVAFAKRSVARHDIEVRSNLSALLAHKKIKSEVEKANQKPTSKLILPDRYKQI